MPVQTVYSSPIITTAAGTNTDYYAPDAPGWFNTKGAYTIVLTTRRTANSGTTPTLQAFAEYLYEPTNTFYPILDYAGTAVQGVAYATGTFDTTGNQQLIMGYDLPPGGTVGVLTYGTVNKAYQIWVPEKIRFRFRNGGTLAVNVFSYQVAIHTRM